VFDNVAASTTQNYTYYLAYDGRIKNIKIWFPRGTGATTRYYFYLNDTNLFHHMGSRNYIVGDADNTIEIPCNALFQENWQLKVSYQNTDAYEHTVFCIIEIEYFSDGMQFYQQTMT
jgi:hypothetical protein